MGHDGVGRRISVRAMRRLVAGVVVIVAAVLLLTEAAMQPTASDRVLLVGIYVAAGLVTVLAYSVGARLHRRVRSLRVQFNVVSISAVAVAALAVLLAARSMFLSDHDRNLVLVALLLGAALGIALAVAVGGEIAADLRKLARAAERVEDGDLGARTEVDRVDEVGEVASAFDAMAERLAATEAERAALLAAIGHDLRTPLSSLQASVEALEDGMATDPSRHLRGMASDVRHLRMLVEDLFLFSRLEAGTFLLSPEPVDVAELIEETISAVDAYAASRQVAVRFEAPGPVVADVDPTGVARVLRNLIDNAIRHSPERRDVTVALSRIDGGVRFDVRDEGPGFPDALRERAFDRFVRGDEARTRDAGAGLGLAIAKGIVEAHGGRISIGPGPGGMVSVELPGRPGG
jgi:signal transduction histidine kinase